MDEALKSAQEAYRAGPSDETRRRLQELIMKLSKLDGQGSALEEAVTLLRARLKAS